MKRLHEILNPGLLLLIIMSVLSGSCMKDKLDFDKVSNRIEYSPHFNAPLIKGSFSIEDLVSEDEDTLLEFRGDTIIFFMRMDSVFMLDVSDLIDIPQQDTVAYLIPAIPDTIDKPAEELDTIEQLEQYEIFLENNIRIDSVFLLTGDLNIYVTSTFNIDGDLRINIPSISINNTQFDEYIPLSARTNGEFHTTETFPLDNARIIPESSIAGHSYIDIIFTIYIDAVAGDTIKANSYANILFLIDGIQDFDALFGYAGEKIFARDTVIEVDLGTLEGVTGTFAITNPKINLNYVHTFGLPIGFNMKVKGYFEDGDSVILDPGMDTMNVSLDYLSPEASGVTVMDRSNTDNIDEFLVFPAPDQVGYDLSVVANPDKDTTSSNYVFYDSEIIYGMEVEIPLEFRADLQFRDTLKFDLSEDTVEEIDYIEYARLYYIFRNEFPVNIDPYLVLYDSITDTKIDTIWLNETGENYFLNAAPVDSEGETIIEQVREYEGMINLDEDIIYKLFNEANKLIIAGAFSSYDPDNVHSVKILKRYKLDFKFGLDTKIHYIDYLDTDTLNN
jgi:hypothetical protein